MATMNISLPDQMKAWVEARTLNGRYANASDYVRDLIRRDQHGQRALASLQAAVDSGNESGDPIDLDIKEFIMEMNKEYLSEKSLQDQQP
jgi:antitoxin ParD1/3/4